ncbi:unnamed protein product [Leptosia nina]|uniref:tRNA pseudouridine synthase n=1 Tax=Leptosia nina TaxID=320188 RepID=A0AAV1JSZ5_9NEOP
MKARYLMYFSYIGTKFRASEKLWLKMGRNYPDPESVQGIMEIALQRLKSHNYPAVQLSSRTDGGVHAINTTAHIDLERPGPNLYESNLILYNLNNFFRKHDISIYIKKILRVNDDFSARHNAISRTYLYRFAVLKSDITPPEKLNVVQFAPIEEWKRCYFSKQKEFDIERVREAAKLFVGYHDFTTFKKFDKLFENKNNRRTIYSIDVRPGRPLVTSYTDNHINNDLEYWEVEIKGRSFVHNQIRRMIGSLIALGAGKININDLKLMLQIPSKHSWLSHVSSSPPDGLYLCNVEYNPQDLIYEAESSDILQNEDREIKL